MDKNEKEVAHKMSEMLSESISLLAKAITYHADVIGSNADLGNIGGKVEITEVINDPEVPVSTNTNPAISFDQVKVALNQFAKGNGKDKTIQLLNIYAGGSGNPKDVSPGDYKELMEALNNG